jgi:hypothetical protein
LIKSSNTDSFGRGEPYLLAHFDGPRQLVAAEEFYDTSQPFQDRPESVQVTACGRALENSTAQGREFKRANGWAIRVIRSTLTKTSWMYKAGRVGKQFG